MSGPKVVRIVTREEILDICRGLLARVDAAIADWTRIGGRNDCLDEEAIVATRRRRDVLAAMIAADRFMDLQKQAPLEEAFIRTDLQNRLADVAERQARARSKERRSAEAGHALLGRLKELSQPTSPSLEEGLARGDAEAMAKGFALIAAALPDAAAATDLAAKLRDDAPGASFSDWLEARPATPGDPAIDRIELRLIEMEQLSPSSSTSAWRTKLAEARNATEARRGLILDGLEIDTGRALTAIRRRAEILARLNGLTAECETSGMPAVPTTEAEERMDAPSLEARISDLTAALQTHRDAKAVAARREAILQGLAGLGYEVNEGMETTWAENSRLVVRSVARPDYGVEISGASGTERMQIRAVAFEGGGRGPDPGRDRDAETIWCGDVSSLQDSLARLGGNLAIEKALPIGATPLKRIALPAGGANSAVDLAVPKARTLR